MAITFAIKRLTSAAILQSSSSKHCGPVMVDSGDVLELVQSYNSATDEMEKLRAERDALAAQVEALRKLCMDDYEYHLQNSDRVLHEYIPDAVADWAKTELPKPTECLAEIKAGAVESSLDSIGAPATKFSGKSNDFVAGFNYCAALLQRHAAKIRKGEQSGTWLRDENVNGGKRQGGV